MVEEDKMTLHGMVEEAYNRHGNKPGVIYDNGHQKTVISYSQLWQISRQLKDLLSGRENEVIGLCLKIDHHMPAILLGVLRSNAAFYNFDVHGFNYTVQVLANIGIQTVIIHQGFYQVIQAQIREYGGVSTVLSIPDLRDYFLVTFTSIRRRKHPAGLAYCITTSGTTGKPKVVMVPHECITPNILDIRILFSMTSDDLILGATALTFDPSIVEIFIALSLGACLLVIPRAVRMMPDLLLEMICERNKVTVMQITPALLSRFNKEKLSETILGDNSVVRVIALGGEKFPSGIWLYSKMSLKNRTQFFNLYGTTEVSCWATCHKVCIDELRNGTEIPLGKSLQDTIVEVHDDNGKILTEGEGKLWIGGSRRQCLLDSAEKFQFDRTVLRDSGDIVRLGKDGSLYHIGRNDRQKKWNGRRINLEEIKMVMNRDVRVQDCELMLIDNQLVVFIVLKSQGSEVKLAEVKVIEGLLKKHLPSHWWPDTVLPITQLPITKHGKIDFKCLEDLYQKRETVTTVTDVVDFLTSKWKEFTNNDTNVTVDFLETENFILAGGDSLKAVQFATIIENTFSLHLPLLIDTILNKAFIDVKEYIHESFKSVKQTEKFKGLDKTLCDNLDKRSVNKEAISNIALINKYVDDMKVKIEKRNLEVAKPDFESEEYKLESEFFVKQDSDIKNRARDRTAHKRKILKSFLLSKDPNIKNDLQYSVGRCNRIFITVNYRYEETDRRVKQSDNKNRGFEKLAESIRHIDTEPERVINGEISYRDADKVEIITEVESTHVLHEDALKIVYDGKKDYFIDQNCSKLKVEEVWRYDTGKCVDASPMLAVESRRNFLVFIGSHSHRFSAIHGETGEKQWEITLPDRIESSACLSLCGNFVIVGCYDGKVYILQADSGDIWWWIETGSQVKCSPVVDTQTGLIYIGSHSQTVYCLNVKKMIWQMDLNSGSIFSSPVISYRPHQLYVATLGGKLFAVNPRTGDIMWEYKFLKPVFSSPAVTYQGVVVGCTDNYLYNISHKGHMLWKFQTESHIFSSPSVFKRHQDDELKTENDTREYDCDQMIDSRYGYIAVGSHDKCLYCITSMGELIWKLQVDSEVYSSPFHCIIDVDNSIKTNHTVYTDQNKSPMEIENNVEGTEKNELNKWNTDKFEIGKRKEFEIEISNEFKIAKLAKSDVFGIGKYNVSGRPNCNDLEKSDNYKLNKFNEFESNDFNNRDRLQNSLTDVSEDEKHVKILDEFKLGEKNNSKTGISVVVFASTLGTLYIVDSQKGEILWSEKLGGEVFSSPVVYNNTVVVGCRNDFVYCFKIS